jgi:hypothetical protein
MSFLKITFLITMFGMPAMAQITWSSQVANIIYSNCSNCHNSNGIAPFELMSYYDVVQNSADIRPAILSREMPPWPPDPQYNRLAHERILTPQQIDDLVYWIDNGTPRGDSLQEPSPPVFSNQNEITNPDHIAQAPVFNVNTSSDLYRCFVVPSGLTADQYITAIEAIPGNRNIVHHMLIYSDTSGVPLLLDALDPDPGYTSFGGTGSFTSKLIGVWVPGQQAYFTPSGMGIRLPANSNIIMQVHYPGGISGQVDSSKVFFKLSPVFHREISIESPLNHYQLDNGPLYIPANTTRTFYAHYTVPYAVSALGVGPHMHLIGKSIGAFGVTPSNDTIPFIDIPDWDFHWQGIYSFPQVLRIPAGTTLYSYASYDNTSANPHNPNDPPQNVSLGEATTDEMMLIYFAYTFYLPGDENIIIDSVITAVHPVSNSAVTTIQLYDPVPNPATGYATLSYFLPANESGELRVFDMKGKLVYSHPESEHGIITRRFDTAKLPAGVYVISLQSGSITRTKRLVVNK